ncbi:MAG: FHA domain-containing protein [Gammaproteobacteria bacterium]|nr:FHA domain-containing protein [Gammaproteobacteria bacterium]
MANDKNNINELVSEEDDPTAELETLALKHASATRNDSDSSESAANTYGYGNEDASHASIPELRSDLKERSETISRLQFDIEQLRAKWMGLETEITAREEITDKLNQELVESQRILARKEKLLKKRDQSIKALKAEIRDRNDHYGELEATVAKHEEHIEKLQRELAQDRSHEVEDARLLIKQQAGQIVSAAATVKELQAQLERTELYADSLRQQLQERTAVITQVEDMRELLDSTVNAANDQLKKLEAALATERNTNADLTKQLDGLKEAHAEEIRTIRFELGEAQETVAQHELIAQQLASDLVDTREFRAELEQVLAKTEEQNTSRIEQLEKKNRKLLREAAEAAEKLETKSQAINCLLAELSKKSQQIESIGAIEGVIQDIDNRMSERIDDRPSTDRDRVTRVLIGSIEGQELRFPLFKDRLTIGRTEQNDIQLKASYVSRRHAVIVTERDATRVVDWGSKNGVFVNAKRITEHFLKNGDIVTIGTADFRYEERPKRDA